MCCSTSARPDSSPASPRGRGVAAAGATHAGAGGDLRLGAFMDLAPSREGRFEAYDQYMRTGLDNLERTRVRQREYSWMNYGDTYGERVVNWTNQEYDMQWGLLVNYARTGDMAYLDRALEAALHTVEIDMINWSDDPGVLGIQKEHAPWHVGGYDTPQPEGVAVLVQERHLEHRPRLDAGHIHGVVHDR
jgi:hypothetical protein